MPVAGEVRIVLSGALPASEVWSTSFALDNTGVATQDDLDGVVNDVAAACTSSQLASYFSSFCGSGTTLTMVRGYFYSTSGGPAAIVSEKAVTGVAGAAANPHPNQIALVCTLLSGIPGRRHRGRCYFPMTARTLTNGQLNSTDTSTVAGNFKSFFDTVNGPSGGTTLAVSSAADGAMLPVASIRVDSKPDTQRRRAQSSPALFQNQVDLA